MRLYVVILTVLFCASGALLAATATSANDASTFQTLWSPPFPPITFDGSTPLAVGTLQFDDPVTLILDSEWMKGFRASAPHHARHATQGASRSIDPPPLNLSTEVASFILIGTGLALLSLLRKFVSR